ncbi:MAG: hypothetical protein GXW99_05245 [Clostridiales bacterium]|nr:hypothetical protein [Clostridiales bacterium]
MEDKGTLKFSFCGDHEVDALSVSKAISSLVELSSAISENEYPDAEIRLSVKAVSPGSLIFDFVAAASPIVQSVLTPDSISCAADIIEIMGAAFKVKRFLKGKAPAKKENADSKIKITREDGSTLELPASSNVYFIDNRIDRSVTNIINSARLSNGVTGISVQANEIIEIPRDEFDQCATEIPINELLGTDTIESLRQNETIFIRSADFSGTLKWRFSGAETFAATVSDEQFVDRVKSGEIAIRAKMYLIADVKVSVQIGPDGMPDESRRTYDVVKVHSIHVPGEGQIELGI